MEHLKQSKKCLRIPIKFQSLTQEVKKYRNAKEFAKDIFKKLNSPAYSEGKTDNDRKIQKAVFDNMNLSKKLGIDTEKGLIAFYGLVIKCKHLN